MSIFMTIRIAMKALGRNKMRTALTMLGMIIGVAAVIAMVALGTGAQRAVEHVAGVDAAHGAVVDGGQRAAAGFVPRQHQRDGQRECHADGHRHQQFHQGEAVLRQARAGSGVVSHGMSTWVT